MQIHSIKHVLLLTAMGLTVLSCTNLFQHLAYQKPPVKPATFVDPHAYSGYWYEIAYLPTFFQKGCRCSMINYVPVNKNKVLLATGCVKNQQLAIKVVNMFPTDKNNHAKNKVEIFWPFQYDHWILYVDPQYHYALVGTPNHKYLWILSRTPNMPYRPYHALLDLAKKQGYDLSKLHTTPQLCSIQTQDRLMDAIQTHLKAKIAS